MSAHVNDYKVGARRYSASGVFSSRRVSFTSAATWRRWLIYVYGRPVAIRRTVRLPDLETCVGRFAQHRHEIELVLTSPEGRAWARGECLRRAA